MFDQQSRFASPGAIATAEGWSARRLTPPSRLFGANGLRTGPDGRIYVAQVSGSQISAIDVNTGAVEAISAKGGAIVAPDDLVFDDKGNLFATEITEGRVCMLTPRGETRVVCGDLPVANPITWHQGRLIAGECRVGARIMELDLNGGAPRIIADNLPMVNAFDVGPDGKLYFPLMGTNQICRIGLDGSDREVVASDLGVPDAVKFDAQGFIISTQVASGQVLRIDPRTGDRTVLAQLTQGLDNVTFVGERLFVSNISGSVTEILPDQKTRDLVPDGFNWPLGLAVGGDGALFVADGPFSYALRAGEPRRLLGMLFTPGCPGYCRGAAAAQDAGSVYVTTANGQVAHWNPGAQESQYLADGFDRLYGIATGPAGALVFAEGGRGRLLSLSGGAVSELAQGLAEPMGVAVATDGAAYVSENGGGRVSCVTGGRLETVIDGLGAPQGLALVGGTLFILDAGLKQLLALDLARGARSVIASGLPVGAPAGVTPKFLGPIGDMSGPMGPFAGLAAGPDGTLYVSGDADGSVLAITPGGPRP